MAELGTTYCCCSVVQLKEVTDPRSTDRALLHDDGPAPNLFGFYSSIGDNVCFRYCCLKLLQH